MKEHIVSSELDKERADTRVFTSWWLGDHCLQARVFGQPSVSHNKGLTKVSRMHRPQLARNWKLKCSIFLCQALWWATKTKRRCHIQKIVAVHTLHYCRINKCTSDGTLLTRIVWCNHKLLIFLLTNMYNSCILHQADGPFAQAAFWLVGWGSPGIWVAEGFDFRYSAYFFSCASYSLVTFFSWDLLSSFPAASWVGKPWKTKKGINNRVKGWVCFLSFFLSISGSYDEQWHYTVLPHDAVIWVAAGLEEPMSEASANWRGPPHTQAGIWEWSM